MYPIIRFIKEMTLAAGRSRLGLFDTHRSRHICWPWDLDPWMEMNNGRTLTLYDLGRLPMMWRAGAMSEMRRQGWGMSVAGASIRYRRRVRVFNRFTMTSRILGWDNRFLYVEQSMWRGGEATSSILCRMAITDENGIVAPAKLAKAMNVPTDSPELPEYVRNWIDAEATRPWPPQAWPEIPCP